MRSTTKALFILFGLVASAATIAVHGAPAGDPEEKQPLPVDNVSVEPKDGGHEKPEGETAVGGPAVDILPKVDQHKVEHIDVKTTENKDEKKEEKHEDRVTDKHTKIDGAAAEETKEKCDPSEKKEGAGHGIGGGKIKQILEKTGEKLKEAGAKTFGLLKEAGAKIKQDIGNIGKLFHKKDEDVKKDDAEKHGVPAEKSEGGDSKKDSDKLN